MNATVYPFMVQESQPFCVFANILIIIQCFLIFIGDYMAIGVHRMALSLAVNTALVLHIGVMSGYAGSKQHPETDGVGSCQGLHGTMYLASHSWITVAISGMQL